MSQNQSETATLGTLGRLEKAAKRYEETMARSDMAGRNAWLELHAAVCRHSEAPESERLESLLAQAALTERAQIVAWLRQEYGGFWSAGHAEERIEAGEHCEKTP